MTYRVDYRVERDRDGAWEEVSRPKTSSTSMRHARQETREALDHPTTRVLRDGEEIARFVHDPSLRLGARRVRKAKVPRKLTEVLERDINGRPARVSVRDERGVSAIIVKRESDDSWTPLYGIGVGGRIRLPTTFRLNRDCLIALDALL